MLEMHRTAPPGSASIEDEPFAEQLRRNRERHATLAKLDAIVWMIGVVLLCAFGYAFFSTF